MLQLPERERERECFAAQCREWTREMDEVLDGLKDDLISEVDDYITTTLKGWVIQEVNRLYSYLHSTYSGSYDVLC